VVVVAAQITVSIFASLFYHFNVCLWIFNFKASAIAPIAGAYWPQLIAATTTLNPYNARTSAVIVST
jgi:hypothetical protein